MKYLMIIITAVVLMNCGDTIISGSAEYHELEVDMEEFCFGKPNGTYYLGPIDGYNMATIKKVLVKDDYITENLSIGYVYNKGFEFWCPDTNSYIIVWN